MGYWEPPPPSAYDPAPRPLRWSGDHYPELEDQKLFGIGAGRADGALIVMEGGHPLVAHLRNLPNNPGMARPFRPDWNLGNFGHSTEEIRLDAYRRLIALRVPGLDPERGGLAADAIADDGTIGIHYWDMSDDRQPSRKRVSYWPKSGDIGMRVEQFNFQTGAFEDEGFDFERDFSNALPAILQAIQVASSAILGALTGNAALAGAWSSALGLAVKAAAARVPPDPAEVLASFGAFAAEGAKAAGGKFDLGQVFGSASMRSDFMQSFQGMLEKIRTLAAEQSQVFTFADQIRAAFQKGLDHFPPLGSSLETVVELGAKAIAPQIYAKEKAAVGSFDPELLVGTESREIGLAVAVFGLGVHIDLSARGAADDIYYSMRKCAFDKGLFDATFASLIAEKKRVAARDAFNAEQDKFRREHPEAIQAIARGSPSQAILQSQAQARVLLESTVQTLKQRYGMA